MRRNADADLKFRELILRILLDEALVGKNAQSSWYTKDGFNTKITMTASRILCFTAFIIGMFG